MNKEQVIEILKNNFSDKLSKDIQLDSNTEFISDLSFDSISFMELFLTLEEILKCPIISGEYNYLFFSIVTIQDLCDAINKLLNI